MSGPTKRSLPLAPPPWTCKATVYALSFYHSASTALPLDIVYDPLELHAASFSSDKETGKYVGGLGFAQIIRYSESPVGTYDELAILPGFFSRVGIDGKARKDSRITGVLGQSGGNLDEWEEELEYTKVCYRYTYCTVTMARWSERWLLDISPASASPLRMHPKPRQSKSRSIERSLAQPGHSSPPKSTP